MNFCINCGAKLAEGQNFCIVCGNKVEPAQNEPKRATGIFAGMKQKNLAKEQSNAKKEMAYIENQSGLSNNYLLGLAGALIGGFVGAIPWAIIESQGWFVAWLGYIIAIAASKGYDLMKVKISSKKIWCVAGAVVFGVFAGQIMSDMIVIATDKQTSGMFSAVFGYYAENFGEYLSVNAENLLMGLFFAALGAFSVLKDIKTKMAAIEQLHKSY